MRRGLNLAIFPLLCIIAATIIFFNHRAIILNPEGALRTYLSSAARGNFGYGMPLNYTNDISFAGLEAGDIILGAYPDCAYGRYSHAAIYVGQGQVIEGYADLGIVKQPLKHFREYPQICLLRVKAAPAVKKEAVAYVSRHLGQVFFPVAFKSGQNTWNCTKIMWKAYQLQGLDFDNNNDLWVPPDSIYNSGHVTVLRENGLLWF